MNVMKKALFKGVTKIIACEKVISKRLLFHSLPKHTFLLLAE